MKVYLREVSTLDRYETDSLIKRSCRYIKSDAQIASICGVSSAYVADLRAKLPVLVDSDESPISSDEERARKAQAVESNTAFMRRLLGVCVKRGFLPGSMTAADLEARCAEYGVRA